MIGLSYPRGLSSLPTPGLGLGTLGAVTQRSGKAAHWLCQDFTAEAGSWPDSPCSWEKGPAHFPRPCTQDLRCPPGKVGTAGPLVLPPAHPQACAQSGALVGAGPSLPTNGVFYGLHLHQARSEVLGVSAWSQASTLTTRPGTRLGLVKRCF